ncbi:MAG: pyridoxamine 5'-phosphate oxidase [Candidatus Nanopelagicales bacterium]
MSLENPASEPTRLAGLRVHYDSGHLQEGDLPASPLDAFTRWLEEAIEAGVTEPNAMVLATATSQAQPSSRTVLLKNADERGFIFYTNLGSRKSREISENPQASCVFPWLAMHRQVCVVGRVEAISRAEAHEYFDSRPRESQLGAWASEQSAVIADRGILDERFADAELRYPGLVPMPDFWGGWLLVPETVEFWQGRPSRLHDRLRFRRVGRSGSCADPGAWAIERLSP